MRSRKRETHTHTIELAPPKQEMARESRGTYGTARPSLRGGLYLTENTSRKGLARIQGRANAIGGTWRRAARAPARTFRFELLH